MTLQNVLIIMAASVVIGLAIALIYIFTHRKDGYSPSFPVTLALLPPIIAIIIMLVGNNVARAFSLAGAFSIIRFRSAPGDPKDITYIFFSLAIGLSCGMGYISFAIVCAVILALVIIIMHLVHFSEPKNTAMSLKITLPENINYSGLFNDILDKYALSWHIKKVKTSDFGSLFELSYRIQLRSGIDQKAFIDEIRARNGNLNVSLTMREYEDRVYA